MKIKKSLAVCGALLSLVVVIASCSSKLATLSDLPVFTGAVEHKSGDKGIGSTLNSNNQMDTAMRNAVGVGGKTEQKGFRIPENTSWNDVESFYDDKLKASGWTRGKGGKGQEMMNNVMGVVNKSNPVSQTGVWAKGKQNLTVIMITNPVKSTEKDLILSLSSM